jgi:hypothetical protein
VGGSDSVSSLSVDASASVTLVEQCSGKNINTFILQVPCHVFQPTLFSQKCH